MTPRRTAEWTHATRTCRCSRLPNQTTHTDKRHEVVVHNTLAPLMKTTPPRTHFDDMYAAIGRAIWNVQYIEDVLNSLITIKQTGGPGRATNAEALAILKKHRRNTLGTSVRIAKEGQLLSSELLEGLAHLKTERDWLVHRCQHSVGDLILSPWGQSEIVRRASAANIEALALLPILVEQLAAFVGKDGHALVVSERLQSLLAASQGANPSTGTSC